MMSTICSDRTLPDFHVICDVHDLKSHKTAYPFIHHSFSPIFAVLWIVLLLCLAWPIAGICAGIWLLLQVSMFACYLCFWFHLVIMQHEILTILFMVIVLLKPFSPLKDASHLSKTSLISSRNLSPGLATVDVQLETAHPGSQNHVRCVCKCILSRRDCVGDNIC